MNFRIEVSYSLDESKHTKTLQPGQLFSYQAARPGLFKITKVCQTISKKECCTQPKYEMKAQFWAIPTVKVANGDNLITDLREGDRAEVVATFVGEPPFSWRYARMEAVYDEKHQAKHGKRPKILDTHTERNIQGYTDTFTTLTEGKKFTLILFSFAMGYFHASSYQYTDIVSTPRFTLLFFLGTIVPIWIKDKHCQFGKEF